MTVASNPKPAPMNTGRRSRRRAAGERGGDRREDQDGLEALAEEDDRGVADDRRAAHGDLPKGRGVVVEVVADSRSGAGQRSRRRRGRRLVARAKGPVRIGHGHELGGYGVKPVRGVGREDRVSLGQRGLRRSRAAGLRVCLRVTATSLEVAA